MRHNMSPFSRIVVGAMRDQFERGFCCFGSKINKTEKGDKNVFWLGDRFWAIAVLADIKLPESLGPG